MRVIKKYGALLLAIILLFGCAQTYDIRPADIQYEPVEDAPVIEDVPAVEEVEENQPEGLPLASDFPAPINPYVIGEVEETARENRESEDAIVRSVWWDTRWPIIVQWNNDGTARVSDARGVRGQFFLGDYMVGDTGDGLGSVVVSVSLESLERYQHSVIDMGIPLLNMVRVNNQTFTVTGGLFHTQLFNHRIEPAYIQLRFDFGADLGTIGGIHAGTEYLIISLVYNESNQTYMAVYSPNPYAHPRDDVDETDIDIIWGGNFDNSVCELSIAIFDDNGNLIETFTLYGVIYPLVAPAHMSITLEFPMLYILDETTALLVPQHGRYDFLLPITINLSDQTFRRWSEEEVNAFLQNDDRFELDLERQHSPRRIAQLKEYGWSTELGPLRIRQTRIPSHIQSVLTNESLLIFADGDEVPLFAVPSELTLRLYHQTEDGTRYFVFEL